jgi:alpha-beta hydrolase superfamily lysophospholipase
VLVVQSENDVFADWKTVASNKKKLEQSQNKDYFFFKKAYHAVLNEEQLNKEVLFPEIKKWIEKRFFD